MSVFRELLAIKAFRESQAEAAVRVQRDALREAREAREAAEALLQRLLREGLEQEMQLYRDLCARIVRLREIEDVQLAVVGLRQREAHALDLASAAVCDPDWGSLRRELVLEQQLAASAYCGVRLQADYGEWIADGLMQLRAGEKPIFQLVSAPLKFLDQPNRVRHRYSRLLYAPNIDGRQRLLTASVVC